MDYFIAQLEKAAHVLRVFSEQPSVPSSLLVGGVFVAILTFALISSVFDSDVAPGTTSTFAGKLFSLYIKLGRVRNLLCSPCDRLTRRYPVSNTCQVPMWKDLSALYTFVFGYKSQGVFVEIGAYDGESFSNTSCLADLGWRGHYVEAIPQFAAACKRRHASNPLVTVHNLAAGLRDGDVVSLVPAGPFTSADENELKSVTNSKLGGLLSAFGWAPQEGALGSSSNSTSNNNNNAATEESVAPSPPASTRSRGGKPRAGSVAGAAAGARGSGASEVASAAASAALSSSPSSSSSNSSSDGGRITMRTTKLDTFFAEQGLTPGSVDVFVLDVEGLEWPILQGFSLGHWRPKLVIVELQQHQARYLNNAKVQADALQIEAYFREAGYSILYRDGINTVFKSQETACVGGD